MTNREIPELVDHLFRHESARIIAALTRLLGIHNLDVAEEIVQDTLVKALQVWPFNQPVENPSAWLMRVAKNKAIDLIRREKHRRRYADEMEVLLKSEWTMAATVGDSFQEHEIADDQLRMIFTCCHTALNQESQVVLTLRLLCGLTAAEIAGAFLCPEETIRKRIYRAKQRLQDPDIRFEVPDGPELVARLDVVLTILYLLFNEGYNSPHTATPVRKDLCREALRLALLLSRAKSLNQPKVLALIALMSLHCARIPARTNPDGSINVLERQDRSLWDKELIAKGIQYLNESSSGELTKFHLEAGIAACHCEAESFEATNWPRILELYDLLLQHHQTSPIIRLNRAIALGYAKGAQVALTEMEALAQTPELKDYYLLPAALGEFHLQLKQNEQARDCFRKAASLTASPAERALLKQKLARVNQ